MAERYSSVGRIFVGAIIAVFVGVLVAVALFPGITSGINSLTSGATPQVTGTSATLLGNVVLFAALGVMLFVVGFALVWLHGKGAFAIQLRYGFPVHVSRPMSYNITNYDNNAPLMQT